MNQQELKKLAKVLSRDFGGIRAERQYGWTAPPWNVLDCVLSLNRRYDSFVRPRMQLFVENHPTLSTLRGLAALVRRYPSPLAFSKAELNYDDGSRALTLLGVTDCLISTQRDYAGETEQARLVNWARSVSPSGAWDVGVRGFGLAGFQYLRMLFGVQTAKPDVHTCRYVSQVLCRNMSSWAALEVLEAAAKLAKVPLREVDNAIWNSAARPRRCCSD